MTPSYYRWCNSWGWTLTVLIKVTQLVGGGVQPTHSWFFWLKAQGIFFYPMVSTWHSEKKSLEYTSFQPSLCLCECCWTGDLMTEIQNLSLIRSGKVSTCRVDRDCCSRIWLECCLPLSILLLPPGPSTRHVPTRSQHQPPVGVLLFLSMTCSQSSQVKHETWKKAAKWNMKHATWKVTKHQFLPEPSTVYKRILTLNYKVLPNPLISSHVSRPLFTVFQPHWSTFFPLNMSRSFPLLTFTVTLSYA